MAAGGVFLRPNDILDQVGVREGAVVADFGCGAGYFSLPLGRYVGPSGTVYAIDVQTSALDVVESRAIRDGLFMIKPIRANLEAPEGSRIEDESVDLVFLTHILYQVETKRDILNEAYRILRERGRLVIVDWERGKVGLGPVDIMRVGSEVAKDLAKETGFNFVKTLTIDSYHYGLLFQKHV